MPIGAKQHDFLRIFEGTSSTHKRSSALFSKNLQTNNRHFLRRTIRSTLENSQGPLDQYAGIFLRFLLRDFVNVFLRSHGPMDVKLNFRTSTRKLNLTFLPINVGDPK